MAMRVSVVCALMFAAWPLLGGCASAVDVGDDGGVASNGSIRTEAPGTVGASCLAPQAPPGSAATPVCGNGSCFVADEVVYSERAPSCGGALGCMVYHWDQRVAPDEQSLREFCTCRCDDGAGHADEGCACPAGFACTTVFRAGGPELRGAYCIRAGIARP